MSSPLTPQQFIDSIIDNIFSRPMSAAGPPTAAGPLPSSNLLSMLRDKVEFENLGQKTFLCRRNNVLPIQTLITKCQI